MLLLEGLKEGAAAKKAVLLPVTSGPEQGHCAVPAAV
jgi:hypothetical protein